MKPMPQDIEARLAAAAPAGIQYRTSTDAKGVITAWCTLASADELLPVARVLQGLAARLSTVTVFQPKAPPVPKPKPGEEPPPPATFFGGVVSSAAWSTRARPMKWTTTSTWTATP